MKFFIYSTLFCFSILACNQSNNNSDNISKNSEEKVLIQSDTIGEKRDISNKKIIEKGEHKYEVDYYESGKIKYEGNWKNGKKTGKWMSFYESGLPWSETRFIEGKREGNTASWYENGKKRFEGQYKNDKRHGKWSFWDEEGNLIKEEEF